MQPQGWYRDPYRNHDDRWFSGGKPTSLVRDRGSESYDDPPQDQPPPSLRGRPAGDQPEPARPGRSWRPWRPWTVLLPGLLMLAPWCYSSYLTGGAGFILATPAVALLVAGMRVPHWRRPVAVTLWAAFALTCYVIWQALRAFGSWS